jgi:hypothetical protein
MKDVVQPVSDGDRHDKGRNQLNPHPHTDSPRRSAEPTLVSRGSLWRGVETLFASGGFQTGLERGVRATVFLTHSRPWRHYVPESERLLPAGSEGVKNA